MTKRDPLGPPATPIEDRLRDLASSVAQPVSKSLATPFVTDKTPPKPNARRFRQVTVLASPDDVRTIQNLCQDLSHRLGGPPLNVSLVTRALWAILADAAKSIPAESTPQLARPSNHDQAAFSRFEEDIARFVLTLVRREQATDGF